MRLRPRPPRILGEDWVLPRWSGRSTTIGNLDSEHRAGVDPAGLVTVDGVPWSLDWWIGAEDRWHLPCREVALRQSLVGSSPVVETRLRVPSGDAVHRAYAARALDGSEAIVIEVENQSKLPFAVALAVRPHTATEVGRIDRLGLDGWRVLLDGQVALVLARSPGRMALSDAATGDSAHAVFAGDALPVRNGELTCVDGLAQGALLFPLAHTAVLRVVVPLSPTAATTDPADYPAATQVASGWTTHAATGTRIEVPDRRLRDAVAVSGRHLLLASGGPDTAAALDLLGFPHEAARLLLAEPERLARAEPPGEALEAVARHWELTADAVFAEAMVEVVASLVARLNQATGADAERGRGSLAGAAALLDAAGQPRAAADARRVPVAASGAQPVEDLDALLLSASSTWTWPSPAAAHDARANASLVRQVRNLLLREELAGLAISPVVPDTWLGQGWELHGAPTRHGLLSVAVRWHADRPALLWELLPHPGRPTIVLTTPALDPTWSTTELRGEALLAPVAIPERAARRGLTIPVTIEPMPGRRL